MLGARLIFYLRIKKIISKVLPWFRVKMKNFDDLFQIIYIKLIIKELNQTIKSFNGKEHKSVFQIPPNSVKTS